MEECTLGALRKNKCFEQGAGGSPVRRLHEGVPIVPREKTVGNRGSVTERAAAEQPRGRDVGPYSTKLFCD